MTLIYMNSDSDDETQSELDQSETDVEFSKLSVSQWIGSKGLDAKLPTFNGEYRMPNIICYDFYLIHQATSVVEMLR